MSINSDLLDQLSMACKDTLEGTFGATISYVSRQNAAITLIAYAGLENDEDVEYINLHTEEKLRSFHVPGQPGLLAFTTTKALTSNVATITTREAHGFVAGQPVRIMLDNPDSVFDGLYPIATVPTTTTFTYAKTNANVASTAATGFVEANIQVGDKVTYESFTYEIRRYSNPSIRVIYKLDCAKVQTEATGIA